MLSLTELVFLGEGHLVKVICCLIEDIIYMSKSSYIIVWQVVQRPTKCWWMSFIMFPLLFRSLDEGTQIPIIAHVVLSKWFMTLLKKTNIFYYKALLCAQIYYWVVIWLWMKSAKMYKFSTSCICFSKWYVNWWPYVWISLLLSILKSKAES